MKKRAKEHSYRALLRFICQGDIAKTKLDASEIVLFLKKCLAMKKTNTIDMLPMIAKGSLAENNDKSKNAKNGTRLYTGTGENEFKKLNESGK